jgi:hypothetical protein
MFDTHSSDSATSSKKLQIPLARTDYKHQEFRIKENSGYISYKMGAFFKKRKTLP